MRSVFSFGLMGAKLGTIWARAGTTWCQLLSQRRQAQKLARDAKAKPGRHAARSGAGCRRGLLRCTGLASMTCCSKRATWQAGHRELLPADERRRYRPGDRPHVIGAEALAKKVPMARVSHVGTVPSEVLFGCSRLAQTTKPSLVYLRRRRRSKKTVAQLIRDVGSSRSMRDRYRSRATRSRSRAHRAARLRGDGGPELAYRFVRSEPPGLSFGLPGSVS